MGVHVRQSRFFFQAEDGIRDLVRSRGLGDVYKRQRALPAGAGPGAAQPERGLAVRNHCRGGAHAHDSGVARVIACCRPTPVSYTHLTLPTSDLV